MRTRILLSAMVAIAVNACTAKIDNDAIYGEYSVVVDGIENILIISPNGTYTQKKVINGEMKTTNSRAWRDYSPEDDDIRYSLVGFQFPSKKASGEWHAQLGTTWGKLSLCYFDDGGISECYIKSKSSSKTK